MTKEPTKKRLEFFIKGRKDPIIVYVDNDVEKVIFRIRANEVKELSK